MQNFEFKAELRDLALARSICAALGARRILDFVQTDTYFRIASGRLKRREMPGEPAEYIFYDRVNHPSPRASHFVIYSEEQARERFGEGPLPVWVVVRKHRELWMLGNVRIHLDEVEGLGTFLEFEAMVSQDHDAARCHQALARMRQAFAPVLGEAIDCSYSDMAAREQEHREEHRPA
jgi:adenylate cyclase, class 2